MRSGSEPNCRVDRRLRIRLRTQYNATVDFPLPGPPLSIHGPLGRGRVNFSANSFCSLSSANRNEFQSRVPPAMASRSSAESTTRSCASALRTSEAGHSASRTLVRIWLGTGHSIRSSSVLQSTNFANSGPSMPSSCSNFESNWDGNGRSVAGDADREDVDSLARGGDETASSLSRGLLCSSLVVVAIGNSASRTLCFNSSSTAQSSSSSSMRQFRSASRSVPMTPSFNRNWGLKADGSGRPALAGTDSVDETRRASMRTEGGFWSSGCRSMRVCDRGSAMMRAHGLSRSGSCPSRS